LNSQTTIEYLAAALALLGIGMMVMRLRIGWIFNFCSSILYFWIFFQNKLYGDAGLQVFFALMQVLGWLHWKTPSKEPLIFLRKLGFDGLWNCTLCLIGCTLLLGVLLSLGTDTDVPWTDAFCTSGSVVAQVLQITRYRENWLLWILVNLIYIPLYLYKSLPATALLYAVFLGMAIWGWIHWNRQLRASGISLKSSPSEQ